jgi:alanyl-tRNA synthetase
LASAASGDLATQAVEVAGIKLLAVSLDGADAKTLGDTLDKLKNTLGSAVILLASSDGDKVNLIAGVTKDLIKQVKAGDLIKFFAPLVGGKGGGRPDMARGAGSDVAALAQALEQVPSWLETQLG